MTAVADLLTLQETDIALDRALARLAEIEEALGEPEELIEARAVVEEKAAVVRDFRAQQTDLELAVDEVRGKAAEIEKKLYSGSVTNPKELQDFDADLKSLKQQTRKREDDLLTLLVQVDEAETELKAVEAQAAELESAWRSGVDQMLAEKAHLEPEAERLRAERSSQATGFERTLIGLYDLLRERRGGRAVARIERGMCQGCRITLPTSVLQKVRSGAGVVQCVSCERILLLT
jgi:predicted  nucleic acid-binding Zn-ribbon protein